MSIFSGSQKFQLEDFNGQWNYVEASDIPPSQSQLAKNVEFRPGQVRTASGFGQAFNPAKKIPASYFWYEGAVAGPINNYVFANTTDNKISTYNTISAATTDIKTSLTNLASALFVHSGNRIYVQPLPASVNGAVVNNGSFQGFVWDQTLSSSLTGNELFHRPLKQSEITSIVVSQPSSGISTVGTKKFGMVFVTQEGYTTYPLTDNSGNPYYTSSTLVASKNIQIVITPASNWPNWIKKLQILMAPTANLNQFYLVPNTLVDVPYGTSTAVTVTFDISDLVLRGTQGAEATKADDYLDLLHQNTSGVAPFYPKLMVKWGDRMVYGANYGGIDTLFVSEPGFPQWVSANQHVLTLPGNQTLGAIGVMGKVLYASGPGWTYAWTDNGDRPSTFAPPKAIGEGIGTNAPLGLSQDNDLGFMVVAGPAGAFICRGWEFDNLPLSYNQSDKWDLIDWNKPLEIKVTLHPTRREIWIRVMLTDGGVEFFVWDYSAGLGAFKSKFYTRTFSSFVPAHQTLVLHPTERVWELWVSTSSTAGKVLRQKSFSAGDATLANPTALWDDDSVGIDSQYQTGLMPPNNSNKVFTHLGGMFRLLGVGTAGLYAINMDSVATQAMSDVTLAVAPGRKYLRLLPVPAQCESISYKVTNKSTVGSGFILSSISHAYNLYGEQR